MSFTQEIWEQTKPIYNGILELPFNQELMQGTLRKDRFEFYIKQDALYLADFGRALALAGVKAPHSKVFQQYLEFAEGAVVVERQLHESYMQTFESSLDVEKSPTCVAYTNFLLSTAALSDYYEVIAALLPCFWIYREVGNHIFERAAENNFYQEWIDTYAGEEFSQSVDEAIRLTDEAAADATEEQREKMRKAYEISARLEWMFWDSAYRLEEWKP